MDNILGEMNYEDLYHMCSKFSHNLILILSNKLALIDINPQAEKILKWRKQDTINQSILHLFETTGIKPFIDNIPKTTQRKVTYISQKTNNLKIFWTIAPLLDAKNKLKFIGIFGKPAPEVTDKELRMQLENVIKYAPGLFYWKDKNSVYQGGNDEFAHLAGLDSWMQVKGKTDFELAWQDRAEEYVNIDKQVIESGQANLNREEKITTSDKSTIRAITNKVPLFDKKNRVIGLMGITTDITHQKEVERCLKLAKEQAEIANRAKSEFIANMSHDIRTPLSGIVGISQVLKERVIDEEEKQYVQWISECGEQLLDLLNGILEVVSADNVSENDLHLETFDLHECVQDIIQIGRPSTQLKGIELVLHVAEDVPKYIVSDRTKLHRILLNLLGNAIKFTEKGAVHISLQLLRQEHESVTVKFQVEDTGIGIPFELQDKVFDRFFRASPSYKGMYEGHGVGLHIAESYVDLLGGAIQLSSTPGQGTTFYFDLTFKQGCEASKTTVQPGSDVNSSLNLSTKVPPSAQPNIVSYRHSESPRMPMVLLVEDNEIARKVMECLMKDMNISYTSCLDAESAFSLLKTQTYALLITDIGLPGISGTDLAIRIRAWEKAEGYEPLNIIGLTAHAQERIREECLRAGMNDIYSKPMHLATLKTIRDTYLPSCAPAAKKQPALDEKKEQPSLSSIPLLDLPSLLRGLNQDNLLFKDILQSMVQHEIPRQMNLIEKTYLEKDWQMAKEHIHKMKSGAMYCATTRLQHICQMLEDALSSSATYEQVKSLYVTLKNVAEETQRAILHVLNAHHSVDVIPE